MPKHVLGRTGLTVSFLGFGVTDGVNPAVYRRAVELGVSYFHLSVDSRARKNIPDKYNKVALGALRPFRKRLVISHMSLDCNNKKAALLADLDDFLHQSGFGHLDLWYICCPSPEYVDEFREAMAVARKGGKARWAALSTHRVTDDMSRLTASDPPVDAVMMSYNFLSPQEGREQVAKLHAAGLGIVPMKPLAGRFYKSTTDRPDALIRWLSADTRVHTIPVCMSSVEQVEQNVAALQRPFSEEDRRILNELTVWASPRFCRMCGVCDGRCRNGLAVSDLIRTAMYADGYGDLSLARTQLAAIPSEQRRASCDNCNDCSIHCPNGVAIRDRIRRAMKLLA